VWIKKRIIIFAAMHTPKQLLNEQVLTIYGLALCAAILGIIVVKKWHRKPYRDHGGHNKRQRATLSFLLDGLPVIFFLTNAILCLTIFVQLRLNHFASRFGWHVAQSRRKHSTNIRQDGRRQYGSLRVSRP
jgi:hypothetical protein